jgi:hypothetical protein
MRADERIQVSDNEFLPGWNVVAQQIFDDAIHDARVKNVPDQRHEQEQERKKRKNGIGGNREREGVNFGSHHVPYGGTQKALNRYGSIFSRALLIRKCNGSEGSHCFLKSYQRLTQTS